MFLQKDKFAMEFPFGLVCGIEKPQIKLNMNNGKQSMNFILKDDHILLQGNIYPSLGWEKLVSLLKRRNINANGELQRQLVRMCQTQTEKDFLIQYARIFQMTSSNKVPVLLPQAWVQWNSLNGAMSPCRVDFVTFWKKKRYIIEIDGQSHHKDEDAYTNHLHIDRWLQKQNWEVFRLSNLDVKTLMSQIEMGEVLEFLRTFIGF